MYVHYAPLQSLTLSFMTRYSTDHWDVGVCGPFSRMAYLDPSLQALFRENLYGGLAQASDHRVPAVCVCV